MKFERTTVMNFENALIGMRNPMNSWDKSDSDFGIADSDAWFEDCKNEVACSYCPDGREDKKWEKTNDWLARNGELRFGKYAGEYAYIGKNDLNLAQKLIKAGPEHRKFMRQIYVSVDITAPLFWWKEFDQYKISVTTNSTSTMHKLATTPITWDCFETDDYEGDFAIADEELVGLDFTYPEQIINTLEALRERYLETRDKRYWKELIRWLPESWLQTRTITMSYENLINICRQRRGHKLSEWHQFIDWVSQLPYANELIFYSNKENK